MGLTNWLMVAVLRCVRPQFQLYQLVYATEMKSIQLHDSIEGLNQKIVSITSHYITHYITLHYITLTCSTTQGYRQLPGGDFY